MGERVAHMLTGGMMDYIEFDDEFSIARTLAPSFTWDKTLAESAPRSKHGVTIVGIERSGEEFTYARPATSVARHGTDDVRLQLFVCLPDGLSSTPSVGTGTVMRPSTLRGYGRGSRLHGLRGTADRGLRVLALLPALVTVGATVSTSRCPA